MVAFTAENCIHGYEVRADGQDDHGECKAEEFIYHGARWFKYFSFFGILTIASWNGLRGHGGSDV
jgi:hypothetical protein